MADQDPSRDSLRQQVTTAQRLHLAEFTGQVWCGLPDRPHHVPIVRERKPQGDQLADVTRSLMCTVLAEERTIAGRTSDRTVHWNAGHGSTSHATPDTQEKSVPAEVSLR